MGRNAGYIALWCGIANGAEDILLPEKYDYDEQRIINSIIDNRKKGKSHHIIINAEGVGHSVSMSKRIEGNEIPYFDFDFIVRRYFGMSDEDLKLNQRYKDEKKLKDEGYKQEDIAKILDGAPKDEFKAKKPKKEKDDEGDENGGGPLAGL